MSQATTATTTAQAAALSITRQFVNFACFKLDPEFRRLPDLEKEQARAQFAALFAEPRQGLLCLTYSTVGLRPDVDFVLWRHFDRAG